MAQSHMIVPCHYCASQAWSEPWSSNVACAPVKFDCEAKCFLSERLTDLWVMSSPYSYFDIQ